MILRLSAALLDVQTMGDLRALFEEFPGNKPLTLVFETQKGDLDFPALHYVDGSPQFQEAVERLLRVHA